MPYGGGLDLSLWFMISSLLYRHDSNDPFEIGLLLPDGPEKCQGRRVYLLSIDTVADSGTAAETEYILRLFSDTQAEDVIICEAIQNRSCLDKL